MNPSGPPVIVVSVTTDVMSYVRLPSVAYPRRAPAAAAPSNELELASVGKARRDKVECGNRRADLKRRQSHDLVSNRAPVQGLANGVYRPSSEKQNPVWAVDDAPSLQPASAARGFARGARDVIHAVAHDGDPVARTCFVVCRASDKERIGIAVLED